ncbi:hypothetical protein Tco_1446492 [Tanacetum coccineum]
MDDPDITMEEYVQLETDRALRNGKVYSWETATYGKIWKTLVERENVGFDLTKSDICPSFVKDPIAKGVGLRVADSLTGNHQKDGFTPLKTIRRFLGVIGSKSHSSLKRRPSSWRGGVHISRFNPFGMVKLTTFAVMCKAYGGEPSVDLLRAFLNLGPAGNWLTLSNRGGSDVPKALTKPITHLEGWKGSFFFIENKIIPFKYPALLLEDNKLDKKSFEDIIPLQAREDPLYNNISTYPCNVRTFPNPILYLAGLKTSWKHSPKKPIIYHHEREIDVRSFMMEGVDGEFNFLPEGGLDEEGNLLLLEYAENIGDSDDALLKGMIGISPKTRKKSPQASKASDDAFDPLDVDSDPDIHEFPSAKELKDSTDCHWVVAHVTPSSWKQHLKEINLEKLYDIHDRAYMRQVVLDNTLNSRTCKLIFALSKAMASCDAIRERQVAKDKIETLHGQVDKLLSEYSTLILEEKKLVNYEQTLSVLRTKVEGLESKMERLKSSEVQLLQEIDSLRQDRADVVSKVIPHVATKLIRSDRMGLLVARLVKAAMFHGRCTTYEEVGNLKEPFILKKMPGYRTSSRKEFDQAGDYLATASHPFITKATANPYAIVEQLLSKKLRSLYTKPTLSYSKPSSLKAPIN